MEKIIYRKTLDAHKNGIQFMLQGFETSDKMARSIEISLMASGDTVDLPLEQITASMYVTVPNAAEPSIYDCEIKDNTIVFDIPQIAVSGITIMQLKVIETSVCGARSVLASPKFAAEVSLSCSDDDGALQKPEFTALEDALAKAEAVYDSRVIKISLSNDFVFSVEYADGTVYKNKVLQDAILNTESTLSRSWARGGTGTREGEDTDNSMYYSNVSKSAGMEADRVSGEAGELLNEVTKHGVYTSFNTNFEKGELEYASPAYEFEIDKESGELTVIGTAYSVEEIVFDYLNRQSLVPATFE